jgi:hypothetical protein
MADIQMTVESRGPLFRQPMKAVNDVSKAFLQRMVELGEQRLDTILSPKPQGVFLSVQEAQPNKASTGNYRRNVSGKVVGSKGTIDDGRVVYGSWLEGTSSRNATTQFKGYASFRKTSDWLQQQVGKERKAFERQYARRLNGV